MKLNEIVGKEKAKDQNDLYASIHDGKFTKDGSHLIANEFSCYFTALVSLEGCPQKVNGGFYCYENKLVSLEGGPQEVGSDFSCSFNKITSLERCPQKVGGHFYCDNNKLTSLKDIHKHLKKMNGTFDAEENTITSHVLGLLKIPGCKNVLIDNRVVEEIMNRYLPLGDIFDCQEELIEAGFPEYAQL